MCGACEVGRPAVQALADECVAAGIAWLNENAPADWREHINLDELDINNVRLCVLGQVFADRARNPDYTYKSWDGVDVEFTDGYEYAGRVFDDLFNRFGEHGFMPFSDDYNNGEWVFVESYDMTHAWVRALTA
jgi:hypothetical protein